MITLDSNVRFLRGVGPARAKAFADVGVHTIRDLLRYYPRDYAFVKACDIANAREGDFVLIRGQITSVSRRASGGPHTIRVTDDNGSILCTWFGGYIGWELKTAGSWLTLWGRVSEYNGNLQLNSPKYSTDTQPANIVCVVTYPATKALPSTVIAKVMGVALSEFCPFDLKEGRVDTLGDMPYGVAIKAIHRPENKEQLKRARERLKYEELLALVRGMKEKRSQSMDYATDPIGSGPIIHSQISKLFPFDFTHEQLKAVEDVVIDMGSTNPMYRLLQGDVGCGKTAVAVYASILAAIFGKQTVVMVPTQVLAHQHYDEWEKYLCGSQYEVCLLTSGSVLKKTKLSRIARGYYDIVIATTSVLSDKVKFKDLGLLVVDEQHRFGVKQKDALVEKYHPNQLYMSATPIPRALSLTAFGDLDITIINEMPYGRGSRLTQVVLPQDLDEFWYGMSEIIAKGCRTYEVFPRIHGVGGLEEALWSGEYCGAADLRRAVVHGERKPAYNAAALDSFRRGETNHLMCTSMVEVGMHVEGANHMIIHEANRFGLPQLHQMRGRIGRGSESSYCYLLANTDDSDAHDRLRFLEQTDDGFAVAEKDLELRGPGELLGTRQHGLSELKLADLVTDYKLLLRAKENVHV